MARKTSFGTPVTGSGGITSLNGSSTWTAGYEWYLINNSTDLAVDRIQSGTITPGGSGYNNQFRIYVIASYDGSTWPDVFDGTPSAETVTSQGVRDSFCRLAWCLRTGSTPSVTQTCSFFFSIADLFGGIVPPKCVVFFVHNSSSAMSSTAGNHTYSDTPVFEDIT